MVKLLCSKEQALKNIEQSAKQVTLSDFISFVKQFDENKEWFSCGELQMYFSTLQWLLFAHI